MTQLLAHLLDHGMEVVRDFRGGMGGREILLGDAEGGANPPASIRLLSEGSHWSVGLKFDPMVEYRTPDEWEALILGRPAKLSTPTRQASFIQDNLELARNAYVSQPDAERALAALGAELVRRENPGLSKIVDRYS
jgi:hypothetical protein